MKFYLAISAPVDAAAATAARLAALAPELAEQCLPGDCGSWRHEAWSSRDRSTMLLGWSNEPASPKLLGLLTTDVDRALGVPGYLCDRADAARLLAAADPAEVADELAGVFGVYRADQQGFIAVTTAVRVDPVYRASAAGVELAGNRALLVHLVARALVDPGRSPPVVTYDLAGVASLVRHFYIMGDETPFEGVSALPAHSTLRVRHGRATVARRPLPAAEAEPPTGLARRRQIRQLADGLAQAVTPLAQDASRITVSLTGGRDSRMIAAALYAAGLKFDAFTKGHDDHPDVIVARRVAAALGMKHSSREPPRTEERDALLIEDPLVRTQRSVQLIEGMISTHYNLAQPAPFTLRPRFTGAGGEQFRGGYLSGEKSLAPARLQKRVRDMFLLFEEYLTPWARERAREQYAPWAEEAARDPADALDKLYLYHRSGRWAGASRVAANLSGTMLYPLFDNALTRRVLAMCIPWRWSEEPMHRAISRLAPPLRHVPLVSKRWRYQPKVPPRFLGRRAWHLQAAVTAPKSTGPTFDWRKTPDPPLVAMLREQILDGPPALMEIIDRAAVEELLAVTPLKYPFFVWSAYTAGVILSGSWQSAAESRPRIQVKIA